MTERLIFGVHTKEDAMQMRSVNPCVDLFGKIENIQLCKGCRHLMNSGIGRGFYRCRLNPRSGMRKKHSEWWPACARYENGTEER
jgi:hypothetical protein